MRLNNFLMQESSQNPQDTDIEVGATIEFKSENGVFSGSIKKMKGDFAFVDIISTDREAWEKSSKSSWKNVKVNTQINVIMVR